MFTVAFLVPFNIQIFNQLTPVRTRVAGVFLVSHLVRGQMRTAPVGWTLNALDFLSKGWQASKISHTFPFPMGIITVPWYTNSPDSSLQHSSETPTAQSLCKDSKQQRLKLSRWHIFSPSRYQCVFMGAGDSARILSVISANWFETERGTQIKSAKPIEIHHHPVQVFSSFQSVSCFLYY